MPKMIRLDRSSETMNRGLAEEKGTTFGGLSIETTVAACFGETGAEIVAGQGNRMTLLPALMGYRRFVIVGYRHSC